MTPESAVCNNRLARVARFLAICGATWVGLGCYFLLTSRFGDAMICLAESVVSFVLIAFVPNTNRRTVVNVYLTAITIGLLTLSYLSGLSASYAPTFFCVVVLLAAYLLGPRAAWTWAAVALSCLFLIHFGIPHSVERLPGSILSDRILGQVAMLFLVLMFSVLAEISAEQYAEQLQTVSDELLEGTRKLNELVGVDTLTSLPNRHQFHKDVEAAMERAESQKTLLAVLLIDLNDFKQINDTMGHAAGDQVLRVVSERLIEAVGPDGIVARLGGDEFTVVVENLADEFAAALIGGKIVRSISRDYRLDGRELNLGASVGAAAYPKDGHTIDELLSFADAAMYEAKSKRLGVQLYVPSLTAEAHERREFEDQLNAAIVRDEFSVVYQPQVDLRSGNVVGMEALLRWEKNGEFIAPSTFISYLEDSGSILEVGRWVLHQACSQAREWNRLGSTARVSVNVSSVQFDQRAFLDDVWNALEVSQLDPSLLDLELTETVFLDRPDEAIGNIEMLRETGVSISIDDFGTGYSSLSYLKALPINRLKIDRSFIKDIPHDDDGMIAETVIGLAHNMGMSVVAEGVATEEQLRFLKRRGCDEYQGYLFSQPLAADQCCDKLGIGLPLGTPAIPEAVKAEDADAGLIP